MTLPKGYKNPNPSPSLPRGYSSPSPSNNTTGG